MMQNVDIGMSSVRWWQFKAYGEKMLSKSHVVGFTDSKDTQFPAALL